MNTGIYSIEHLASGKKYIGSAVNFAKRWNVHRHHLSKGTHHSAHLQAAWSKHGEDAFEFRKLLVCSKENLLMYEQLCIDGYKVCDREQGYNADPTAGSRLGTTHSAETRAKISKNRSKPFFSAECRARMSAKRKGSKMPAGFSEAQSLRMQGFRHTAASLKKMSDNRRGKPATLAAKEARAKLSQAQANQIRDLCNSGLFTQTAVAPLYGVCQGTISDIMRNKHWAVSPL